MSSQFGLSRSLQLSEICPIVIEMRDAVVFLSFYLLSKRGDCTGISLIDATALKVCHNLRIPLHKVFKDSAERDKSSIGRYYGFKLHLAINVLGEIIGFYLTARES